MSYNVLFRRYFLRPPTGGLSFFEKDGLRLLAAVELPPGAFPGAMIEGTVIVLRREVPVKKFVGAIRDPSLFPV
jgi:hypothetical protein